ncbi:Glu/Leu/Phe/Val dehydrogenase dimerization domain-containing protein [Sphaerisporangium perillae]|uniref:Glu/Leu/Phe/Val dehydrogenase dimerization domain-containing protein n=1 Tax=Sphaerisporangium perillae TaxID=2935860 RepID=UPI002435E188|nr:Glu/Leu/Phe/Val dehydrogenase dimerization domain-containing protein [Sphaerisporangium perillae]
MPRVIEYTDPVEGCSGYLVYDREDCRLAAGGFRVQPGLKVQTLIDLAERMTLKQRVLGINVDGAKSGLDYDPMSAGSEEVISRFLTFIAEELNSRYSMGCDMGTRFEDLERLAAGVGLRSVKYAVKHAQGFSDDEYFARMRLLDAPVGRRTLGQRRAGHVVAHSALAAADSAGYLATGLHIAIQGFGNLGRAAAESLVAEGASIVAVADAYGCAVHPRGLDIVSMLEHDQSRPVSEQTSKLAWLPGETLFDLPVDVLVLAAVENAITPEQAATLQAPVVVVGANCGLSEAAEQTLNERGVLVVPDFIGGIGGSASMETLFGPEILPEPHEVLENVGLLIRELVIDIIAGSRLRGMTPRQVALDIAAAAPVAPDRPPYGISPYSRASRRPRGNRVASAASRRSGLIASGENL